MLKKIKIKSKYDDLRNGLLYVTDDLRLLQKLREAGEAAAAVLTPENRDEDFSGVPYAVERMEELEEEEERKKREEEEGEEELERMKNKHGDFCDNQQEQTGVFFLIDR